MNDTEYTLEGVTNLFIVLIQTCRHDAVKSWLNGENNEEIKYFARYQLGKWIKVAELDYNNLRYYKRKFWESCINEYNHQIKLYFNE